MPSAPNAGPSIFRTKKTRERKEKEGREGTPDLGREPALAGTGVYPRSAGPHVLARATKRPASTFHGGGAGCWVKSGSPGPGVFTAGDGVRERPQETKPVAEGPGGALQPIQRPWSHALGNSAPWWTHGEVSEVQVAQSSDSLRPQGLQPARLLYPWDSPGKNMGWGAAPFSRASSRPRDRT